MAQHGIEELIQLMARLSLNESGDDDKQRSSTANRKNLPRPQRHLPSAEDLVSVMKHAGADAISSQSILTDSADYSYGTIADPEDLSMESIMDHTIPQESVAPVYHPKDRRISGRKAVKKRVRSKKPLAEMIRVCPRFVRSDAVQFFVNTWEPTLAAWASLLRTVSLPPDIPIENRNGFTFLKNNSSPPLDLRKPLYAPAG